MLYALTTGIAGELGHVFGGVQAATVINADLSDDQRWLCGGYFASGNVHVCTLASAPAANNEPGRE